MNGEGLEAHLLEVVGGLLVGMKMKTHLATGNSPKQTAQPLEGVIERHALV